MDQTCTLNHGLALDLAMDRDFCFYFGSLFWRVPRIKTRSLVETSVFILGLLLGDCPELKSEALVETSVFVLGLLLGDCPELKSEASG